MPPACHASIGQVLGPPGVLGACGFATHRYPSGKKSGCDPGASKGNLWGLEIHSQSLERLLFRHFSGQLYLALPLRAFFGKEKGSPDS